MNRIFKRIASSILAAAVTICSVNAVAFADYESADETGINESFGIQYPVETGNDFTFTEISDEEMDNIVAAVDAVPKYDYNEDDSYLGELGRTNYSSHYFYDQLSTELKSTYNTLYNYCLNLECSEENATIVNYSNGTTGYIVGYADISGNALAVNDIAKLYSVFFYENPRFYFIEQGCSYSSNNGYVTRIAMTCNESFYNGSVRATASTEMYGKVSSILNTVDAISDPVAKEDYIAKYICDNTVYEKVDHHQSAYGALVAGKAVCAGYTNAYSLLCSAAGLEISFTCSPNHVWNRVKYYDNWYCTDVTWMDGYAENGMYVEKWHNKSYSTFVKNDDSNGSHSIESKMSGYTFPDCIYDEVQLPPVVTASTYGHSLCLNGNIGVNFYLELSDAVLADENSYMKFTVRGKSSTVYTKDIKDNAENQVLINGIKHYKFTCEVTAKQMTETISADFYATQFGEEQCISSEEYTVQKYAKYMLEHSSNYDAKAIKLVKAIINYGAYAQIYFDGTSDNLPNSLLEESEKALPDTIDLTAYERVKTGSVEGLTYYGSNLTLESQTTLRHFFVLEDGRDINDYTFKVKGTIVTPQFDGTYYYIEITSISSNNLDTGYEVSVGDFTLSNSSALTYAKRILESESDTKELKDLVKALYLFNKATDEYLS